MPLSQPSMQGKEALLLRFEKLHQDYPDPNPNPNPNLVVPTLSDPRKTFKTLLINCSLWVIPNCGVKFVKSLLTNLRLIVPSSCPANHAGPPRYSQGLQSNVAVHNYHSETKDVNYWRSPRGTYLNCPLVTQDNQKYS